MIRSNYIFTNVIVVRGKNFLCTQHNGIIIVSWKHFISLCRFLSLILDVSSNREQPAVVCGAHAINQIQLLFLLTGSILESVSKKKNYLLYCLEREIVIQIK